MCGLLGHRSETQLGVLVAARVAQGARRSASAAGAVCAGTGLYFSPVVVCRPCGLHTPKQPVEPVRPVGRRSARC